ncbi:MAG: NAD-dependent epimerase/dehydratase family protein [Opitutales bacterium]|nr:NAD-dependent epimerase/dehydratase family protein [Opitutales bacterium]MDP4643954.1 NAD-dependent epimerase/dehydratase family protein [Opitutales bacterium]MDP4693135.1 NAD-dependent epimerase/dehydratase family protein [Opitutales bacterium]MDP4777624.1 NAD-dependent epimerase/dehydratase family protein [Opitutales bacterium]MDP4883131.1 NAD-dependent epimerase/dehydratase family protein [Opitutales bacterium]
MTTDSLPKSLMIFGCGYVGTALAAHCIAAGVRVGALTRNPEKAERLRGMGVAEVVVADLHSSAWHEQLSGDYEAVVNCVSSAGGGLEGYRQSYLEGQASILKWAEGRSISCYVYTSSTSVYPQDGGVSIDELADTSGAPETGKVILESEQLIADAAADLGRWYVLRLAGIYGPKRHYLLDQLRDGGTTIAGSGDYTLNLAHLEDIVSALCAALSTESAPSGIYNIADDAPSSKAALVEWLAGELQMSVPVFDPDNVSSRVARRGGRMPDRKILNTKAKALLGWAPKYSDFREGYRAILSSHEKAGTRDANSG